MNDSEIFRQAARAADEAVAHQFGGTGPNSAPTTDNAAGDYWRLVFTSTCAALYTFQGRN